jgi:hypothetical protein
VEISSLPFPHSPVLSEHLTPSAVSSFSVSCLLLFSFVLFFCGAWVSLSRGLYWLIPGVAVGILHAAYLLTYWSASAKQVWSRHLAVWEPSYFLSVMWHGEALYRLVVQGIGILILLGVF